MHIQDEEAAKIIDDQHHNIQPNLAVVLDDPPEPVGVTLEADHTMNEDPLMEMEMETNHALCHWLQRVSKKGGELRYVKQYLVDQILPICHPLKRNKSQTVDLLYKTTITTKQNEKQPLRADRKLIQQLFKACRKIAMQHFSKHCQVYRFHWQNSMTRLTLPDELFFQISPYLTDNPKSGQLVPHYIVCDICRRTSNCLETCNILHC